MSRTRTKSPRSKTTKPTRRSGQRGRSLHESPRYRIRYTATGAGLVQLGYHAAEQIRRSGRPLPQGGSADLQTRWDRELIRRESQALDRDNGIYAGLINRGIDNIVGNGFTLAANSGDKGLDKEIESAWAEWSKQPEARGLDDWHGCECLVLRHLWVDGDHGILLNDDGEIQLIESERIAGPSMGDTGIMLDAKGRPTKFLVCDYDDHGFLRRGKPEEYAPDRFLFLAHRTRTSQTRGMPVMTPNLPMVHRINDVCDSEAVSWQILSRLALAINKRDADLGAYARSQKDDAAGEHAISDRCVDVGDALIFNAEPGEEIKGIDRNIPGGNFTASITMYLRLLGLPLGLPLELVLLDWSRTSYSSARAALEQAYRVFVRSQNMLANRFHSPTYRWWLKRQYSQRNGIDGHQWYKPGFPWIDQLKEAQACGEQLDRGLATHAEKLASRGIDRAEWLPRRAEEITEAIEQAKKIEQETGGRVPWQMFCGVSSREVIADEMPDPNDPENPNSPNNPNNPNNNPSRNPEGRP